MAWSIERLEDGDVGSLQDLAARTLQGEIAGFRLPAFATPAQCASLAARLTEEQARVESYADANVSAAHLGAPAIKYSTRPQAYFAEARAWNARQAEAMARAGAWDAAAEVVKLVAQAFPGHDSAVASDAREGSYFHGIIRRIARSPLHNDFARRDFAGWLIGNCDHQLAWNIYLTGAAAGEGETIIYRKRWAPEDEAFKKRTAMGYKDGVVAGVESARYRPQLGDLMVFNCVNYHEVTQNEGLRLTIGGFIGLDSPGRKLWFWS